MGVVSKRSLEHKSHVKMNVLDWRSTTNKRVVESSLAAETHAANLAHLEDFCRH